MLQLQEVFKSFNAVPCFSLKLGGAVLVDEKAVNYMGFFIIRLLTPGSHIEN